MTILGSNSKVVQICNISIACQKDQLKSLFNCFGRINEIALYPESETLVSTINGKVGYIKFDRSDSVYAALNMTNTIFIDRPLIVSQVFDNTIPDEIDAMIYCSPLNPHIMLISGGPTWPSTVIHRLIGQQPNAIIETIDPELTDRNLPAYPPLPGIYDLAKVEEIRRTVYLSNLDKNISLDVLHEFLCQIGEIRYIRSAYKDENSEIRDAYVEFSEQQSIPKVLSINGFQFFGRTLFVNHSTSCVIKPATVRNSQNVNSSDGENLRISRSHSRSMSQRNDSDGDDVSEEDDRRSSSKSHRSKSKKHSRSRSRDRYHRSKNRKEKKSRR